MNVWIIGAGVMSAEYIDVLNELNIPFKVIGRGVESAEVCRNKYKCEVISGGLSEYLSTKPEVCTHAIVAVDVDLLCETTINLLEYNVKNILTEKPAGLDEKEIEHISKFTIKKEANVLIAYNRRFFASVNKAKEIIDKDGGVLSFNFEFTEWSHIIEALDESEKIKAKYILANSSHVIDLAFYLGGKPKEIATFSSGALTWHPSSSIFAGAGISDNGALFSYQANWESAGRWSVEILTKENRLILRPMEKLQIQKRGTIAQCFVEDIDYTFDDKYKAGLYLQVQNFFNNNFENMSNISEQLGMVDIYNKIANY